jgi:hypothetical protein
MKDHELRHTVRTLVAFHDVEDKIRADRRFASPAGYCRRWRTMIFTLLVLLAVSTAGGRAAPSHVELGLRPGAWPAVDGKPAIVPPSPTATSPSDTSPRAVVRPVVWRATDDKPLILRWPPAAEALADTLAALGFVPNEIACEGALVSGAFSAPSDWGAPEFEAIETFLRGLSVVESATVDLPGNPSASMFECPGTTTPEILYRVWPSDSTLCSRQVVVHMIIDSSGRLSTYTVSPEASDGCAKALAKVLRRWRFRAGRELFRPVNGMIDCQVGR